MLLHTVKHQNKMAVVEKFYTINLLTVYPTYLPKIINFTLNLPKLLLKNLLASFVDTVLYCGKLKRNI